MADEYEDDDTEASVSPLQMLMGQGFGTVTPEGKTKAAEVFGELYSKRSAYDDEEKAAYDEYEQRAQEARQVLKKAREALAAKKTPTTKWLEMAKGFGAPTRAGSFGESISNYATTRIPGKQQEAEWEQGRDKDVMGYDTGMNEIDQALALQRLKLKQAHRGADDKLMTEAMKIMGKPSPMGRAPPRTNESRAQAELDKSYVKDYVEFIQGGAADATKNIEELRSAHTALTKSDMKTGPVIGLIPKIVRDVFLPKASETQEAVESTVQRSLRQILGTQFTAREGESLLARVYNPRLPEEVNARRVARLIEQLDRAYQEKIKAADFFEKHGSLSGYTGKKSWSIGEFLPSEGEGGDDDPVAIAGDIQDTLTGGRPAQRQPQGPPPQGAPAPDEGMDEIPIEALLPAQARGGRVKFAEGGRVQGEIGPDGRPRFQMPDGKIIKARPNDTYEGVLEIYTRATGTAPTRPDLPPQQIPPRDEGAPSPVSLPGEQQPGLPQLPAQRVPEPTLADQVMEEAPSGLGYAAAGAAGAALGNKILPALGDRLMPGRRETPAQRRVIDMLAEQRRSPQDVAAGVRKQQGMGIPAMAMDDPALRATAESAMSESGMQNATEVLNRLKARQEGIGDRVMNRVNTGLKPDEYFEQEEKLKDALYTNAEPLYKQAYAANPAIKSTVLPKLLNTPDGKKAVKVALRLMRNSGKKIGKEDAMGMVQSPSLEFLDNVKRGLDQLITKEEGSGVNYQSTALGKSLRDLRNALRDELDTATTPAKGDSLYKLARQQYEGDLEVLDALKAGRKDFSKLQPQQLEKMVGEMSFSAKDAYRTGVAQHLFEALETPSADFNAAQKVIGSPAQRKKLRLLFDSDKQFQLFETALQKESELYDLSKKSIAAGGQGQAAHVEPKATGLKRVAKHVPRLGWKSPTMWALQFMRNNSEATEKKLDDVLTHLKASTPEELADLEKTLGPKFARRLSRKARKGKVAVAGAAVGLGAKALDMVVADGEEEEEDDDAED